MNKYKDVEDLFSSPPTFNQKLWNIRHMITHYILTIRYWFLTRWFYFWGDLVSKIINYTDLDLTKYYHKWMIKSIEYDPHRKFWKNTKKD